MKIVLIMMSVLTLLYGDFTKSGNIVTNNHSQLQWQDDAVGSTKTWREAIDYCEALSVDGISGWRLPNINELKSIINKSAHPIAVVSAFENIGSNQYWSSTTYAAVKANAWIVDFGDGKESGGRKNYHKYVRCVRGGQ